MTKDEAWLKHASEAGIYGSLHKEAFDAGYDAASVGLSLSYLAERNFCPRCGKRLMSALGPVSLHTCCPPQGRTFDDYGNKLP
jgi:hypothetical protein